MKKIDKLLISALLCICLTALCGTVLAATKNAMTIQCGSGVNTLSFNTISADYPDGESWGGINPPTFSAGTLTIDVYCDRKGSTDVLDWFCSPVYGVTDPGMTSMNFAFTGQLFINGTAYNVVIGQGDISSHNVWNMGGREAGFTQTSGGIIVTPDGRYSIAGYSGNDNNFLVTQLKNPIPGAMTQMLAFNQGYGRTSTYAGAPLQSTPTMNVISTINIINMTPWNIFIGNSSDKNVFSTITNPADDNSGYVASTLWGINTPVSSVPKYSGAFTSEKIPIMQPYGGDKTLNISSPWLTSAFSADKISVPASATYTFNNCELTVPLTFNSTTSTSSGTSPQLNLVFTTSAGLLQSSSGNFTQMLNTPVVSSVINGVVNAYASPAFQQPVEEYGQLDTNMYPTGLGYNNVVFMALQAAANTQWQVLNGITPLTSAASTLPGCLNVCGMVYPKFSTVAKPGVAGTVMDLGVILMSGDGAEITVLFVAVPEAASGGDNALTLSSKVKTHRSK